MRRIDRVMFLLIVLSQYKCIFSMQIKKLAFSDKDRKTEGESETEGERDRETESQRERDRETEGERERSSRIRRGAEMY